MISDCNRRGLLATGGALLGSWLLDPRAARASAEAPGFTAESESPLPPEYPAQAPAEVRGVVGASHGNFERVRELVDRRPELAKASWDWGFGDWESALGAAAHTGNRDIALYLIDHGARPNLFSAAMLGQLDVVRAFVAARPGIQAQPGPHGIPLIVHARLGGDEAAPVVAYLEEVGDADGGPERPPLEHDIEAFVGRYRFEDGPEGAFDVTIGSRGGLMLQRGPEGTARGLVHRGGGLFHPAGAPSVGVRFAEADGAIGSLQILHPDPLVRATRIAP